ncbi:MAG: cobyrinate a,c-diamide synthase [Solirubrobacterales bacterium]
MKDDRSRVPALMISATHSGAGKTTATAAIIRGLRGSGLRVQPFKLGPDFIDPAYLSEAAGQPAINLDLWMMGADELRNSFGRWSKGADIAVIEAMGALYDGEDGGDHGSAAAIAKLLGVPVVLVLDAWGMTRTAGAVLLGMREFDRAVQIAGCILNRVGSDAHREMVTAALPAELRDLVIGAIPREDSLDIPERHLGLLTATENQQDAGARKAAQFRAAEQLDLARLVKLARVEAPSGRPVPADPCPPALSTRARLALAEDAAFCFYYEDNLRFLEKAGFELAPFRPTEDFALPEGTDAVYLGGGYPESFAVELAANATLASDLRRRAANGTPIYAECGGLLYLGRSLTGFDGERRSMSGVLPIDALMDPAHLAISYVEARTRVPSPLGPAGTLARGQEFHQSRIVGDGLESNLYELTTSRGAQRPGGFKQDNVVAGYVHLHLASNPNLASRIMESALAARLASE